MLNTNIASSGFDMRSVTLKLKTSSDRGCLNCLPFIHEHGISVKVLRCAPMGRNCAHSLLRFEGDPQELDKLLEGKTRIENNGMTIEIAKTGSGEYSALVINNKCQLSNLISETGCFLELAIQSDDDHVIFHLLGSDAESVNEFVTAATALGHEINVISVYEKMAWGGLTFRQDKDLRIAFESGYFNIPSEVTLDDLAEKIGISKSTLNIILRRAERKIITDYLSGSKK